MREVKTLFVEEWEFEYRDISKPVSVYNLYDQSGFRPKIHDFLSNWPPQMKTNCSMEILAHSYQEC